MQLAVPLDGVSIDDYLIAEQASGIKHEYVGGVLYAMAGATKEHNQIALNFYSACRNYLRRSNCRGFVSDIKVRVNIMGTDIFYYPDVIIGCDPRDTSRDFLRFPKLIVEVLSASTERLDRGEKLWSYKTIETLEEYVLVAQDRVEVTLFRRSNNWKPEVFARSNQRIKIKSLNLTLSVSALYQGLPVQTIN